MYSQQYIFFLVIFSVLAYLIATDESVASFFILYTKLVKINIERFFWMIRFHPIITSSPFFRWWMMRKYMKEVEKIKKELSK